MTGYVTWIGDHFLESIQRTWQTVTLLAGILYLMASPSTWRRTVREVMARQMMFTGVGALPLMGMAACLAGVTLVAQAQAWLSSFGQSESIGNLLVAIIIRQVAPLIVGLILIGRSATAIAAELASMVSRGEVRVLESQGMDAMVYLCVPRTFGLMVSYLSLTIYFTVISLISGYLFAAWRGVAGTEPMIFVRALIAATMPLDLVGIVAKTVISGLIVGVIACREGLMAGGSATDIPRAVTRTVVSSILAMLAVLTIVTLLTPAKI